MRKEYCGDDKNSHDSVKTYFEKDLFVICSIVDGRFKRRNKRPKQNLTFRIAP